MTTTYRSLLLPALLLLAAATLCAQEPGRPQILSHEVYRTRAELETGFSPLAPPTVTIAHPFPDPALSNPPIVLNTAVVVRLVYGREQFSDVFDKWWRYQLRVTVFNGNGLQLGTGIVAINHLKDNPAQAVESAYEEQYRLPGVAYSASYRVRVDAIQACSFIGNATDCTVANFPFAAGTALPPDVRLELALEVERLEALNVAAAPASLSIGLSNTNGDTKAELRWAHQEGATSYEVEYVWWDRYGPAVPSAVEDIFRGATRLETWRNWHELDLTYAEGFLYYRVRGVSRAYTAPATIHEVKTYSAWTGKDFIKIGTQFVPGGAPPEVPAFESGRTWQAVNTLAEEGKSKKVLCYFDPTQRKRQTVTYLNDTKVRLVGETDYNLEGVEALQILPVPAPNLVASEQNLGFKPLFNRNLAGQAYSYRDFDGAAGAAPLNDAFGAAWYYSYQHYANAAVNDLYKAYIPTAKRFPLTQLRYERDGRKLLAAQGGVGDLYQLGSGRETKYFHATVTSMELQRLFGHEIGKASHYRKDYLQDANGQLSVTYKDMRDRTVATALVGTSPTNVQALPTEASMTVVQNLLDHNNVGPTVSESSSELFNPLAGNTFSFEYDLDGAYNTITFPNPAQTQLCDGCSYHLEIEVFAPNGQPVQLTYNGAGTPKIEVDYPPPTPTQLGPCATATYTTPGSVVFSAVLPDVGTYRVHKVLSVVEKDIDAIQELLEGLGSIFPNQQTFVNDYVATIDLTQCDPECNTPECQADLTAALTAVAVQECEGLLGRMRAQIHPDSLPAVVAWDLNPAITHLNSPHYILTIESGRVHWIYDQNGRLYRWKHDGGSTFSLQEWLDVDDNGVDQFGPNVTSIFVAPATGSNNPLRELKREQGANGSVLLYKLMRYSMPPVDPQFAGYWQPQWARTLAPLHREYCHYERCAHMAPARTFDLDFGRQQDYAAAAAFLGIGPEVFTDPQISELQNALLQKDPFFARLAEFGDCGYDALVHDLEAFLTDYPQYAGLLFPDLSGSCSNTFNLPVYQAVGTNLLDYIASTVTIDYLPGQTPPAVTLEQARWRMFFTLYQHFKQERFEACKHCDYLPVVAGELHPVAAPLPELPSLDAVYDYVDDQELFEATCAAGCASLVEQRIAALEARISACTGNPFVFVDPQRTELRNLLTAQCLEDCDPLSSPVCTPLTSTMLTPTNGQPGSAANLGILSAGGTITRWLDNSAANVCPAMTSYPAGDLRHLEACPGEQWLRFLSSANCVVRLQAASCPSAPTPANGMIWPVVEVFQGQPSPGATPLRFYNFAATGPLVEFNLPGNSSTNYYLRILTHPLGQTGQLEITVYPAALTPPPAVPGGPSPLAQLEAWLANTNNVPCLGAADLTAFVTTVYSSNHSVDALEPCFDELLDAVIARVNTLAGNWAGATWPITLPASDCFQPLPADPPATLNFSATDALNLRVSRIRTLCASPWIDNAQLSLKDEEGDDIPWNTIEHIGAVHIIPAAPFLAFVPFTNTPLEYRVELTVRRTDGRTHKAYCRLGGDNCFNVLLVISITTSVLDEETLEDNCEETLTNAAEQNALDLWQQTVDELLATYTAAQPKCLIQAVETFTVTYRNREHQYTLYYYNQAGNLIRTVPPAGVNPLPATAFQPGGVWNQTSVPVHTMLTRYRYNTLGQFVWEETPDAGVTRFYYDDKQRLRLKQDAQEASAGTYAYTKYDAQGRSIEVGLLRGYGSVQPNDLNRLEFPLPCTNCASGCPNVPAFTYCLEQRTITTYDEKPPSGPPVQENLRSRIATVANDDATYYYSYDAHGNVRILWQYVPEIYAGRTFIEIQYRYDLISGKMKEVRYQPGKIDRFYHKYYYDADHRLLDVFTSEDGFVWENDLSHFYYQHGPLARTEYGQDKVQGMDYSYTVQAWMKGFNLPGYDSHTFEPGRDGNPLAGNINRYLARDQFAYTIGYHEDDYTAVARDVASPTFSLGPLMNAPWSGIATADVLASNNKRGLYNGNVVLSISDIKRYTTAGSAGVQALTYQYDALNRLAANNDYRWAGAAWTLDNANGNLTCYRSAVTYDGSATQGSNGNIMFLNRTRQFQSGAATKLDDLSYGYLPGTNTLSVVRDLAPADLTAPDFEGMHSYTYWPDGNLRTDDVEGITDIAWSVYNKVLSVTKQAPGISLTYRYDPLGQRLMKTRYRSRQIYIRDALGNVMAIYHKDLATQIVSQEEVPVYGARHAGTRYFANERTNILNPLPLTNKRLRGARAYELTDHLGNVTVTLTDQKWGTPAAAGSWTATWYYNKLRTVADYYPYGFEMPGRSEALIGNALVGGVNRQGFNGKENDLDWGTTTIQDYGFRLYSPAIARFLSVDPLTKDYPMLTPYQFASNSPIQAIDLDGLEHYFAIDGSYIGMIPGDETVRVIATEAVKNQSVQQIHQAVTKGDLRYDNLAVIRHDVYATEAMTAQELLDQAHVIYGEAKGNKSDMFAHVILNREVETAHQYLYVEKELTPLVGWTDPKTGKTYGTVEEESPSYRFTKKYGVYYYTIFGVHSPNNAGRVEAYRKAIQEGGPQIDGGDENFGYRYFFGVKNVKDIARMYTLKDLDAEFGYKVVPVGQVIQGIFKSIIEARMDPYTNDKWRKLDGWRYATPRGEMDYDSENRPKKE
jgi:RHS repeat-associated protein